MTGIKLILGGGSFWALDQWPTEKTRTYLGLLASGGIKEIDSAQAYGDSELILGDNKASQQFSISTKVPGVLSPGSFHRNEVVTRTQKSLERLRTEQLDILYLHSPDPSVPIEETLAGIQDLYAAGAFRRFGISNYIVEEVRSIYDHQKDKGWVLPTVYQGNYNPVARTYEKDLFPTLRELGIAFYAYSPAAGGFLTKNKQQVLEGQGRFAKSAGSVSDLYHALYNRSSLLEALASWHEIARDAECSPYSLALRWVAFNSPLEAERGDAVIVGAGDIDRLQEVFDGIKRGPLQVEIVQRIDVLWDNVRHEAPVDNISVIYNTK